MSTDPDSPPNPTPLPTYQQHFYPTVRTELRFAGKPSAILLPGCCGCGSSAAQGQQLAQGAGVEFSDEHVIVGEGCDIVLDGWTSCGHVCGLNGVQPLETRKYHCRTHSSKFTLFSPVFAKWLYSLIGPDGCCMWLAVRPEPCIVNHARTYVTAELLADLVAQWESGVETSKIVNITQHRWLAVHHQHASEYARHTGLAVSPMPWWVEQNGHGVLTDRRKVEDLVWAYFEHFLAPEFEQDMQLARQYCCYGVSTDETYKLALKCSVWVQPTPSQSVGKYEPACYALHTLHSSVTQMVVGYSFMPDKSNGAKEELFRQVWEAQAQVPNAIITAYVGTDNPTCDEAFLRDLHKSIFPHVDRPLDVGDDLWHVMDRIMSHRRSVAYAHIRSSLLGVLKHGVGRAERGAPHAGRTHAGTGVPQQLTTEKWQLACEGRLAFDLKVWEDKMARGAMKDCLGELKHQLAISIEHARLRFLFTFIPHVAQMRVFGTTPNEGGHQTLNRRTKFVTHMRPDHCAALLKYKMLLSNSKAAGKAAADERVPVEVRQLCSSLFQHTAGIPFAAVAARHSVPYIITFTPHEYTRPEYEAQFAMQGGLVT